MAEEVFISYGSPDRDRIQDLVSRLRQAGVTVWIDEAGIEGAAMWSEEIVGAINHCKVLILAISPNSTKSKNVVRELALASEEEKTILPVFIAPTDIPESMKYQLAGIQRVEYFAGNEEEAISSVLRALSRLGISAEESDTSQALGQAPAAPAQAKAKPPTLAIAAVAVIALLAAVFLFKPSNEPPTNKPSAPTTTEPSTTTQTPAKPLDKNRIVVLPFKNIGTAGENDHIVEGIVDDLNTMLSKVDGLKVIGSVSAKTYRDSELSPSEIGRELDTGSLIQGSIQKAGPQLKINVKLIDVNSGEISWAESYNGNETERFALQSQIVKSVGENLEGIVIDDAKIDDLKKGGTTNPKAYDLAQRAKVFLDKNTKVGMKKAIELYEKAISDDPNYADAYIGLGNSYLMSSGTSNAFPDATSPKAKVAFEKALELNPDNPSALSGLGEIAIFYERNLSEGRRLCKMAISKPPIIFDTIWGYYFLLQFEGKHEEMVSITLKALETDPKSPMLHQILANAYLMMGNKKAAELANLKALSYSPTFQWGLHFRSMILSDMKKYDEAVVLLGRGIKDDPNNPVSIMSLGVVYWKQGKEKESIKLLAELLHRSQFEYIKSDIISRFYVSIGEVDKAIQWVDRAKRLKEHGFLSVHSHPWYNEMIELDEYKQLFRDAGLYDEIYVNSN
ncbi:MAG: tetratricopeptide repeat protein [Verrucomicrobia bacterium]|nr:tetratricopeptide repeat protein [Verrucomicrobiota bacterium]